MNNEVKMIGGRAMVPGSSPDGAWVPVGGPGAVEEARRRLDRERQEQRDREAHRAEVRRAEEAAYERRRAEAKSAHEAERRERAEAEAAEARAEIERRLRLAGTPEARVKALADAEMDTWFRQRSGRVPTLEQTKREMAALMGSRARPVPGVD